MNDRMRYCILPLLVTTFITTYAGPGFDDPVPMLVIEGLGNGYSTPAVSADRIFVTGEKERTGYLFSYDFAGRLLWKVPYGSEWSANYPGSRAAPTLIDSTIYTCSGMGDIACFDSRTGEKRWSVNMTREMNGVNAVFGYSMSVAAWKDRIFCLPGGPYTNIACLDRVSGQIQWVSPGDGEIPGYTAPLVFRHHDRNLLVTFSEYAMLGLDAETGHLLWTHELSLKGDAPCNPPVYSDGSLFMVAGRGNGAAKFEISDDGTEIRKIWANLDFDSYFGGYVLTGNFMFGPSEQRRMWLSMDAITGKIVDSLSFKTGSVAAQGDELVIYSQTGMVGLVRLDRGKITLTGSFKITKGTHEHFAHPLLAGRRLFIRHGDVLLV